MARQHWPCCAQSVLNSSARDRFEPHRPRGNPNGKSYKLLRERDLQNGGARLKIRRASAHGGSTPPPGTKILKGLPEINPKAAHLKWCRCAQSVLKLESPASERRTREFHTRADARSGNKTLRFPPPQPVLQPRSAQCLDCGFMRLVHSRIGITADEPALVA